MAELFHDAEEAKKHNKRIYVDRKYFRGLQDQMAALRGSTWVYIGNLSFKTSEVQIQSLFSRVGRVNRVIMGLNSREKTPCGFAFVEYTESQHALKSVGLISGTILDDRQIRVELDFGYKIGRHFGRGKSGGQVRDDRQGAVDPGRVWAKTSIMEDRLSLPLETARHSVPRTDARSRKRDRDDEEEPEDHADEEREHAKDRQETERRDASEEDDEDEERNAKRRKRHDHEDDDEDDDEDLPSGGDE